MRKLLIAAGIVTAYAVGRQQGYVDGYVTGGLEVLSNSLKKAVEGWNT